MDNFKYIKKNLNKLETKGKSLFLAQDQGLEHGPQELEGKSINPDYVYEIAEKGEIDGFIVQKGLAEHYGSSYRVNQIIKLNGKIGLEGKDDPYSPQVCSVRKAVDLNAKAVGYTLYPGSKYQYKMFEEFKKVQEEAHDFGIPVTTWMYPRGEGIKNELGNHELIYASRIGLELGSDLLKVKFNGDKEVMKRQIESAGKAGVLMAGGPKAENSKDFLKQVNDVDSVGAKGFAVGRNIWLHHNPIGMSKAIRDIQHNGKDIYRAMNHLEK